MFTDPVRSILSPVLIGILSMILYSGCSSIIPPDRPQDVEATALSQHVIQVTWTCYSEEYYDIYGNQHGDAVSYFVYRDGQLVADVKSPGYDDGNLMPDTFYCYRVTSYWDEYLFDWFFIQESDKSREACALTYPLNTLSGTVTLSGADLEGVLVELIGGIGFPTVMGTTTTGSDGAFAFTDLENYRYIVSPALAGYLFSPEQYQFDLVNLNATGVDFSAFPVP